MKVDVYRKVETSKAITGEFWLDDLMECCCPSHPVSHLTIRAIRAFKRESIALCLLCHRIWDMYALRCCRFLGARQSGGISAISPKMCWAVAWWVRRQQRIQSSTRKLHLML